MIGKRIRRTITKNGSEAHSQGDTCSAKSFHDLGFEIVFKDVQAASAPEANSAAGEDLYMLGLSCLPGTQLYLLPIITRALNKKRAGEILWRRTGPGT
ncbi:MAG: hypothetical protein HPY50_08195 [Firmicutes bacterium]|nr:hypothetical protein [Bacillota bacterium]